MLICPTFACFSYYGCVFPCHSETARLFLENGLVSRQMARGWRGRGAQEASRLQTWTMSLELIYIVLSKRGWGGRGQCRAGARCHLVVTLQKICSTHLKDESLQMPKGNCFTCETQRLCVCFHEDVSAALMMWLSQKVSITAQIERS